MVLAQKRDTEINGTGQSPKINPHTYSQLIDDKEGKNIQQRKDSLFNQ